MLLELMVTFVMVLHLCICPYTKVEESFNIQAIHDVLNHGIDIHRYDHLEFPGVVPRTFVGPVAVGLASKPLVVAANHFGFSKFYQQYIVRAVLGLITVSSFLIFCNGVETKFGPNVKKWLLMITMTQFHFMFYCSRPLPNVFALSLVLVALSSWLQQRHTSFICLAGASIVIFRFDLIMLFGIILLQELFYGRIKFFKFVLTTILAGISLLGLTVVVDSYFWQRWLWPEGEVMWFNVILNKSHEYGTLPFLWYFYSALPRALSCTLLLVPFGAFVNRPVVGVVWPAIGYIVLYSFLPHKELRFIIYTFPIFNLAAACAFSYFWKGKRKSFFRKLLLLGALGMLIVNVASTYLFVYISSHNYPGGEAMAALHKLERNEAAHVHIDVFSAQTGVTRFTQLNPNWIYNKTEDLSPDGPNMLSFSHLLIGASTDAENLLQPYTTTHRILATIPAFHRFFISFKTFPFPPFMVSLEDKCYVLKKL